MHTNFVFLWKICVRKLLIRFPPFSPFFSFGFFVFFERIWIFLFIVFTPNATKKWGEKRKKRRRVFYYAISCSFPARITYSVGPVSQSINFFTLISLGFLCVSCGVLQAKSKNSPGSGVISPRKLYFFKEKFTPSECVFIIEENWMK